MSESEKEMPKEVSGAEALVHLLEENGVDTIFGYPGGANLPVYDLLLKSNIEHILARHEQGAIHMAEGYARVAGKPGVCLATSGPGATNLVTGLADALLDSIPVVAITGQIPRTMIGTDAFQEVDCINITMPVTKHNELVLQEKDLVRSVKSAFHIADTGRKGPVLIDLPKDVLLKSYPHDYSDEVELPGYRPTVEGNIGQIKKAIKALDRAERPVIVYGGGVDYSQAKQELIRFARLTNIPVARTLMGTGIFEPDDPLFIGMLGTHGNPETNKILHKKADVVFAMGTRFGDRSIMQPHLFAKNAKVIHLDIDPAEIGKNIPVDVPIVGDIKAVLNVMLERVEKKSIRKEEPWVTTEKEKTLLSDKDAAEFMGMIFKKLSKIDQKLNISTDVGRHQMWANHYCTNEKHLPLMTSGGLGTMGFGLPAAIGAWYADKETPVVNITGDGSFMMNMQEFIVAVEHQIPLTVIIINDYRLGMIRELQTSAYNKRYTVNEFNRDVDFSKLAEAMGGVGITVKHESLVSDALETAIHSRKPTIINFDLEKISSSSQISIGSFAS